MPEEYMNIYKAARRAAGFTQEHAAELLGVSVRSLADYETGQRLPPNDVVDRMSTVYNNIPLGIQHVRETNAFMSHVVPAVQPRSLMESAVRLYNRLNRFSSTHSVERLLEIAEDGRIDQEERAEFDAIVAELKDLVQCGMELGLCGVESKE